jgi:hypothetical protein
MVVGSQLAHGVAYWWAYPQADLRAPVLAETGHSYLAYAPVALAFLVAIESLVLGVDVVDRVRGRQWRRLPAWAFVFIPALGFTMQEHLERLVASGVFPWWTVLEPPFWRGLVLQLPLGLLAYAIVRLLERTTSLVARAVIGRRRRRVVVRRGPPRRGVPARIVLPRLAPLACSAAGRAPPSLIRM